MTDLGRNTTGSRRVKRKSTSSSLQIQAEDIQEKPWLFAKVFNEVNKQKNLGSTVLRVYSTLRSHLEFDHNTDLVVPKTPSIKGKPPRVFPSTDTLAKEVGRSRRTVQDAIVTLIQVGLVERDRSPGRDYRAAYYTFPDPTPLLAEGAFPTLREQRAALQARRSRKRGIREPDGTVSATPGACGLACTLALEASQKGSFFASSGAKVRTSEVRKTALEPCDFPRIQTRPSSSSLREEERPDPVDQTGKLRLPGTSTLRGEEVGLGNKRTAEAEKESSAKEREDVPHVGEGETWEECSIDFDLEEPRTDRQELQMATPPETFSLASILAPGASKRGAPGSGPASSPPDVVTPPSQPPVLTPDDHVVASRGVLVGEESLSTEGTHAQRMARASQVAQVAQARTAQAQARKEAKAAQKRGGAPRKPKWTGKPKEGSGIKEPEAEEVFKPPQTATHLTLAFEERWLNAFNVAFPNASRGRFAAQDHDKVKKMLLRFKAASPAGIEELLAQYAEFYISDFAQFTTHKWFGEDKVPNLHKFTYGTDQVITIYRSAQGDGGIKGALKAMTDRHTWYKEHPGQWNLPEDIQTAFDTAKPLLEKHLGKEKLQSLLVAQDRERSET